jgi:hypothetical protein
MQNLYARSEPTKDRSEKSKGQVGKLDVVLYKNGDCTEEMARYPWFWANKPKQSDTSVSLRGCSYRLYWRG